MGPHNDRPEEQDPLRQSNPDGLSGYAVSGAVTANVALGLERLLTMHSAKAAPAIVRLTHDLFDYFLPSIKSSAYGIEATLDPEYHVAQYPVHAAHLNEALRREGRQSPGFSRTMEHFDASDPRTLGIWAMALDGLYDERLLPICRKRIVACRQSLTHELLDCFGTTLALLCSFRDPAGNLEPGVLVMLNESIEGLPRELVEHVQSQVGAPRQYEGIEQFYLSKVAQYLTQSPGQMKVISPHAPIEKLPELSFANACSLLASFDEAALRGASLLAQTWRLPLVGPAVGKYVDIVGDSSLSWKDRAAHACRMSGTGTAEDRLLELLCDGDMETKLLTSIALWNSRMIDETQEKLWKIVCDPDIAPATATLAAYILGRAGTSKFGNELQAGRGPARGEQATQDLLSAFAAGYWTTAPEYAYVSWRKDGTAALDPYRYKGFSEEEEAAE